PKVWELAVLSCATAGVVTLEVTPATATTKKAHPARVTPLARLNNNSLLTNAHPRSDPRTGLRWRHDRPQGGSACRTPSSQSICALMSERACHLRVPQTDA